MSAATTIAAGANNSCVIRSGDAYCWGDNTYGELGNNSTTGSGTPRAVYAGGALSGVTLTQIGAGTGFSCALASTGAAYCWGLGTSGQLGNGTTTAAQTTPAAVTTTGTPLAGVTLSQIIAGSGFACALGGGNAAYCWGVNTAGQRGNPDTAVNFNVPVAVLSQTSTVAVGYDHSCLLRNGKAYCLGDDATAGGNNGATGTDTTSLGNGTTTASAVPVLVSGGLTFADITAGADFACGVTTAGISYCWGNNGSGQLGSITILVTYEAVPIEMINLLATPLCGVTLTQIGIDLANTSVIPAVLSRHESSEARDTEASRAAPSGWRAGNRRDWCASSARSGNRPSGRLRHGHAGRYQLHPHWDPRPAGRPPDPHLADRAGLVGHEQRP